MKRSLYFILPAVFAFNAPNVHALEIDEKLTLRFLNVSSTQKTVLINRGGEDGLVIGDHAKFFITAGVVARGVAEKVSPSRSVWSLYRIVDSTEIVKDKVLNLKIASPVKITEDPSKSLKEEVIPGGSESMNTEDAPAAENAEITASDEDRDELKGLGFEEDAEVSKPKPKASVKMTGKKGSARQVTVIDDYTPSYATNTSRTWEVWGTMYINSLSGTVDSASETEDSTSASASTVDFSGGIEKYFVNYNNFLKEFSFLGFLHKKSVESGDTIKSKTDWLEYGVGINYHFYNSASAVNRLVGYGAVTLGKGTATLESKTVTNGVGDETTVEGTNTFFSAGLGAKYILSNGFGIRGILDYYSSSESYEYETSTVTRTLAGPRIQFGLSYRF
jgi:hypothetical protein